MSTKYTAVDHALIDLGSRLIPHSARQVEQLTSVLPDPWKNKHIARCIDNIAVHVPHVMVVQVTWRYAHDHQIYVGTVLAQEATATSIAQAVRQSLDREVAQVFVDADA